MTAVPANASAALAATVVDELVRLGARHAVLAPGSRSAPLAYALHAAALAGRLTLHTRIDERSAGFLALGIAVSSRTPVPVVTTSGTAVANLHPAVLEASHRGLPLLLLTADRPARLRGTQANQTTDQVRIFGTATRFDADVPPADPSGDQAAQVGGWRRLAPRAPSPRAAPPPAQPPALGAAGAGPARRVEHAGRRARAGAPGGGDPEPGDAGRSGPAPWSSPGTTPGRRPASSPSVPAGRCSPSPPAARARAPNAIRTYRLLLDDEGPGSLRSRVERVVVCGHPTLSRPVMRLISDPHLEIVAVRNRTGYTDPGRRVSRVLDGPVDVEAGADDGWLGEWLSADADRSRALDRLLAGRSGLTPHHVAGAVARALPPRGLLFVGASNPVRDLDLMVPRYAVGDRRLVIGNRGLAGIDGSVSTAVGAALGRPSTSRALALLGDVTFLHDSNGLVMGPDESRPDLTVVVVNDDGGSIFASLEHGAPEYADSFERVFGTPHHVDLAALCAATRTPHWRVESLPELEHALANPAGGVEVVEAAVRRDDRRELDAAIRALGADRA